VILWDAKWLYIVTHFVKSGVFRPDKFVMQLWMGNSEKKPPWETQKSEAR
jgi:hypothetical protein